MYDFSEMGKLIPCCANIWFPQTAFAGFYYCLTSDSMSDNDRRAELLLRVTNGFMLASSLAMYWIISKYGIGGSNEIIPLQENEDEEETESESESSDEEESESDSSDEEETEPQYNELKCRVCLKGYSSNLEKRMPRMMRCGHTVCFGCAKKIEKQTICITCPFCRKGTYEHSEDLPKNYSKIGLLEEMKQERK
uniref:RING-type domain-containing protein n=2 Tax=Caenorhabditis tropicalis TaxID=1561998 RepID=A0A1I7T2N1_9PELO